jgi:hypothetical protein
MQPLFDYLSAPPNRLAILLDGAWGVGKSFAWDAFARAHLHELNLTQICFSVAGLQTAEDLDRAIFQAAVKFNKGGMGELVGETGTIIARAALRWVKIEPDDIELKADLRAGFACGGSQSLLKKRDPLHRPCAQFLVVRWIHAFVKNTHLTPPVRPAKTAITAKSPGISSGSIPAPDIAWRYTEYRFCRNQRQRKYFTRRPYITRAMGL